MKTVTAPVFYPTGPVGGEPDLDAFGDIIEGDGEMEESIDVWELNAFEKPSLCCWNRGNKDKEEEETPEDDNRDARGPGTNPGRPIVGPEV